MTRLRYLRRCRLVGLLGVLLTGATAFACITQPAVPPLRLKQGLTVRELRGWVEDRDHARIGRACMVLYDSNGKQPVASLNASGSGSFTFGKLPLGEYELVISDSHGIFRPLALPVKIVNSPKVQPGDVRVWLDLG